MCDLEINSPSNFKFGDVSTELVVEASSLLESWLRYVDRIFSSISPHDCAPCDVLPHQKRSGRPA